MTVSRRRTLSILVALALVGSLHWAASAAHPLLSLRHLGPVGLAAEQEAIVTVANTTNAAVTATVTLLNASAHVLALEHLPVTPHGSAIVRWPAPAPTTVRATVAIPGGHGEPYPVGLFVYDPGGSAPTVAMRTNLVIVGTPAPTAAALGPYVPTLVTAKCTVGIVNLGLADAPFTVSFFDGEGNLVSAQTLTIAPRRTDVAAAPARLANGVRAEVRAPALMPYLVSNELVDEATGKTIAVLLGR